MVENSWLTGQHALSTWWPACGSPFRRSRAAIASNHAGARVRLMEHHDDGASSARCSRSEITVATNLASSPTPPLDGQMA